MPLTRPLDEDSFAQHTLNVVQTGYMIVPSAMMEVSDSWGWMRERRQKGLGHLTSAARGLMFAVPVVAVFGLLLGSADAVFAQYITQSLDSVLSIFGIDYLGDTFGQGIITLGLATVATGGISYGVWRRLGSKPETETPAEEVEEQPQEKRKPGFKL